MDGPEQESDSHTLLNLNFEGCCCCSRTRVLLEPGLEFDSQRNMCVVESEKKITEINICKEAELLLIGVLL